MEVLHGTSGTTLREFSAVLGLEFGATESRTCICGVQGAEPLGESPQTFDSRTNL